MLTPLNDFSEAACCRDISRIPPMNSAATLRPMPAASTASPIRRSSLRSRSVSVSAPAACSLCSHSSGVMPRVAPGHAPRHHARVPRLVPVGVNPQAQPRQRLEGPPSTHRFARYSAPLGTNAGQRSLPALTRFRWIHSRTAESGMRLSPPGLRRT